MTLGPAQPIDRSGVIPSVRLLHRTGASSRNHEYVAGAIEPKLGLAGSACGVSSLLTKIVWR
jgi:hypothetical protein